MDDHRYGLVQQPAKTKLQEKESRFALYESTRLYAFAGGTLPNGEVVLGCKVLVLPRIEAPADFPACDEIKKELNEFCDPPREELKCAWGFCKTIPYENGGWTCVEYSVARRNGTIGNASDADVLTVEAARKWPNDVAEFDEMMNLDSATPVAFTKKGDRDAVRFNFYKYVYSFGESAPLS